MADRRTLVFLFALIGLLAAACAGRAQPDDAEVQGRELAVEIPTWTPLAGSRPVAEAVSATVPAAEAVVQGAGTRTAAPGSVTLRVVDGNMNVRRGPSVDYDPVAVMTAGESATALGRDRVRRWLYIEYPSGSEKMGWVSTLTEYTRVTGDVDGLPLVTVEPATPAFIRNCTGHSMWVLPAQVELLPEASEPFNEERFPPGEYLVYDLEVDPGVVIQEISLREGSYVEIIYDGENEKSKCE